MRESLFDKYVRLPFEIAIVLGCITLVGVGVVVHNVWKRTLE